ncbi:tyrosine-type recombinase/integrase [Candidatus Saccharibacteria bacterium]|nr:tyrosine-type recombinase/integrase [Candidatus Saccharibacteria bacterium]
MSKIDHQIAEYLDYCKNIRQMSATTIYNKRSILSKFARDTKIEAVESITNQIYDDWVKQEFSHSVARASLNIYTSTILSLLKFYQNSGMKIDFNFNNVPYFKSTKAPRKFYSKAEIAQVLKYTDEVEELMIKIMFETGMRIAELANLKIANLERNKITFIGKGHKNREVYINTATLQSLQKYLQRYRITTGYLWQVVDGVKTENGEPPTVATIRKKLQKVFERAGFDGFYPHALRHSFATDLQRKGASIPEIKEMMGHSSIATTERYLHGFEGRLEELFKKYQ